MEGGEPDLGEACCAAGSFHGSTLGPPESVCVCLSSLPGSLSQNCEHSPLLSHLLHP